MNELFRNTDPNNLTDMQILDPDQPTELEAQDAYTVEQRIKHNIRQMRNLWIQIAEDLYKFQQAEMWRKLGYNTFDEWLAGPDVDLARRTVFGLIEVWRDLVVKRGVKAHELSNVPISKLRDALPAVRRGFVDAEDMISDCRTLGRVDLRQRYGELSTARGARRDSGGELPSPPGTSGIHVSPTGVPDPPREPVFDAEREPAYAICPTCGSRYEVQS